MNESSCSIAIQANRIIVGESDLSVSKMVSFSADHRRIFNALTIPEYIEAWMATPSGEPLYVYAVSVDDVIELRARTGAICILLKALDMKPNHIRYRWKVTADARWLPATTLDVHLESTDRICEFRLHQRAFASFDDWTWHDTFWTQSLCRLHRILEPPCASDDRRTDEV